MQPIFPHRESVPAACGEAISGVVRLTFTDSYAISELEAQCFSSGWNAETIMEAFTLPAFRAYGLLRAEKNLAAYVTVYHTDDCLEILNLGVAPELRRQGLGKRLLSGVLHESTKEGILQSVLDVRIGNTPAIALYEGLGYVRTGRRKGYYTDTHEDALLYTLDMSDRHALETI